MYDYFKLTRVTKIEFTLLLFQLSMVCFNQGAKIVLYNPEFIAQVTVPVY